MNAALNIAKRAMYLGLAGWIISLFMLQRLPPREAIDKALFSQPLQEFITSGPLNFDYKGQKITVMPEATYTIRGLIVSHNDPGAWYRFDLTHDDKSLDTRDLCLIWGSNVERTEYDKVSYHNDDWACNWSYGRDISYFSDTEISNNHLITAKPGIRQQIARLNLGDQVEIKGRLVSYSEERWGARVRHTSLSREDKGNGACEIIFVESLRVLHSYNGLWAWLRIIGFWTFAGMAALRSLCFLLQRRPRRRRPAI